MAKKQHYMTQKERDKLEAYRKAGKGVSWIAQEMGFCRQTIYNELKRGAYHRIAARHGYYYDETHYSADKAQQIHDYNQTAKGRPLKIGRDRAYADFLEGRVLGLQEDGSIDKGKRCSPSAALELARRAGFTTSICASTFYSYITKGVFLHLTNSQLWEKGKKKKRNYKSVQRVAHPILPSISDRPEQINQRLELGHWEMDLIIGKAETKPCLMTLYERKSRQELIFKLPNRQAAAVRTVFDKLERSMGNRAFREKFKTITTDNGPEFLEYDKLVRSVHGGRRFEVYYCHPYSAWEKGGNENHNRMVRRFFPRGTDFSRVTKKRVAAVQDWMNGYPRKILGWRTPNEAAA